MIQRVAPKSSILVDSLHTSQWISRFKVSGIAVLALISVAIAVPAGAQDDDRQQLRKSGERIDVPVDRLRVGDGDTVTILWEDGDLERVRILGIDTPETQNIKHNLPYNQPFGQKATGFGQGAFAAATEVELLRADMMDGYGRTLGYLFINGMNYSVMIVAAHLAAESVSHYGDNGFPAEAKAVLDAAEQAGPVPFEPPYQFRRRMREVMSYWESNSESTSESSTESDSESSNAEAAAGSK